MQDNNVEINLFIFKQKQLLSVLVSSELRTYIYIYIIYIYIIHVSLENSPHLILYMGHTVKPWSL